MDQKEQLDAALDRHRERLSELQAFVDVCKIRPTLKAALMLREAVEKEKARHAKALADILSTAAESEPDLHEIRSRRNG